MGDDSFLDVDISSELLSKKHWNTSIKESSRTPGVVAAS
jgi:hypothetical protein